MSDETDRMRDLVAEVAAAYFSNAHVVAAEIPHVIRQIAASLQAIGLEEPAAPVEPAAAIETPKATPSQVRRSITPDALISFEDGKAYRALKRHLSTRGLTPDEYRAKHGLPRDYPMVAASYSAARSAQAKSIGLGRKVVKRRRG